MKKRWVYMLSLLLTIALTTFGAAAETGMDLTLSIEEDGSATLPEEIEVSVDGLEIEGEALDIQVPVGEDFQLEDLNPSDLADPALFGNAGISQEGEAQVAPVTEEPMMTDASDFEIDENGVLVKYNGSGGDVVVPDGVKVIGERAFSENVLSADYHIVKSVVIPEGVTSIGNNAFDSCRSLTSVTLPNSITSIGGWAFTSCTSLSSVTLPDSITSIGQNVFMGCISLASISIPDGVTSIPWDAFGGCISLTSVTLPDSITSIGGYAFHQCYSLEELVLPKGLREIDSTAFYNSAVKKLTIQSDILTILGDSSKSMLIGSLSDVMFTEGVTSVCDGMFSGCSSLTSVTLPDSLTYIGAKAFFRCDKLKDLTIPDKVTSIGASAFEGCKSLAEFTLPKVLQTLGDSAFVNSGVASLTVNSDIATTFTGVPLNKVVLGDGVTTICDNMFNGCTNLSSVILPDSVTSIGASAFRNCTSLSNIHLPGSLACIGASAFSGCTGLKDITIPTNVVNIGESAFNGCGSLMSIAIPNEVTSIADSVFSGCVNLASITIPSSVMSIGVSAFSGCIGLTSIAIPDGVTSIGSGAFSGCSGLTSIRIPGGIASVSADVFAGCNSATMYIYNPGNVIRSHAFENISLPGLVIESGPKIIDEYAFFGWSNLQTVTLPDTLTEIREGAFERCGMTEITIPKNVKKLGVAAFFDCRQLRTITFNSRLTAVGREAFFGCRKLSTIIINENMTDICDGMFKECEGITRIDIPETVGIIGNSAFESCNGLSSAIIGGAFGEPSSNAKAAKKVAIGTKAFKGCGGMKKIVIPPSVTKIADDAFDGCMRLTIYGQKGSYAHEYAKKHDIPFKEAEQAKSIAISPGKKTTLYMGNRLTLKVKLKPSNASAALKWSSSNKKVAIVDMQGVVTPIKAGKTVITVKTDNGLTAKITVIVVDASGVKIKEGQSKTLKKGGKLKLHAIISPGKVKTKLSWTSSDNRVATVSKTGNVKAMQVGTAVITVRTDNGKKAKIKITVQ